MNTALKALITLLLFALLAFCGFGILATFEPMSSQRQWTFRFLYGAVALLTLLGLARVWRHRPTPLQ
jgi:hypothetical protein